MTEPLRGVNLGGWLVLEKWITPALFDGTDAEDEYTFMQTDGALEKLDHHRKTFITESDFAWLASHGINAFRIPVGYWLLDGDKQFAAGASYLDWAFTMAEKYEIQVLLDVHALPKSQNGNDHSGRIGDAAWQKDRSARAQSLKYIRLLAERYGAQPSLWGFQVINEPNAGVFQLPLRQYYRRAYRLLSQVLPPHVTIVYSDAWSPRIFAFILPGRHRAVMDVHLYHMATLGAQSHPLEWYYRKMVRRTKMLQRISRLHPIIIGEWSGVISGETIGSLSTTEADRLQQAHLEFQRTHYENLAGTFYWTYKIADTTSLNYWDYRSVVEHETK